MEQVARQRLRRALVVAHVAVEGDRGAAAGRSPERWLERAAGGAGHMAGPVHDLVAQRLEPALCGGRQVVARRRVPDRAVSEVQFLPAGFETSVEEVGDQL